MRVKYMAWTFGIPTASYAPRPHSHCNRMRCPLVAPRPRESLQNIDCLAVSCQARAVPLSSTDGVPCVLASGKIRDGEHPSAVSRQGRLPLPDARLRKLHATSLMCRRPQNYTSNKRPSVYYVRRRIIHSGGEVFTHGNQSGHGDRPADRRRADVGRLSVGSVVGMGREHRAQIWEPSVARPVKPCPRHRHGRVV